MKKIIALFVIMLAFGVNANAQQKKAAAPAPKAVTSNVDSVKEATFHQAAIKDVATLSEYVKLTPEQQTNLKTLFESKHRMLAQDLSAERKSVLSQSIEAKVKSTLTPEQMTKIEGNTQLMKVLSSSN